MPMTISKEAAKKFLVVYHRLHHSNPITGNEDLINYIKKIGCIQYDPINVLAYNSHLVLQSRITSYQQDQLNRLLYEDFTLIDAWDKNLSIYHIDDDPYFHRYRNRMHRYYSQQFKQCHELIPKLRERIGERGPISSLDIKDSPRIDWAWAPTKAVRAALDLMFSNGDIYVHHKVNTRKYYDLIENHRHIVRDNSGFVSEDAYYQWHVERRIGGVGLLPAYKDTYAFIAMDGLTAKIRRQTVKDLLDSGRIVEVLIQGIPSPYYIRSSDLDLLHSLDDYSDQQHKSHIIAALDNLIWDRDMIEEIFDFKYRWEVYVPEAKRVFGYYVLPILYGYDFIGRLVMKYNRQTNQLEIHQWYLEPGIFKKDLDTQVLAEMLNRFAASLGAEGLIVLEDAHDYTFVKKLIAKANKIR